MSKLQLSTTAGADIEERKDAALMHFIACKAAVDQLEAHLTEDMVHSYLELVDQLEDARFYYIYCCKDDILHSLD